MKILFLVQLPPPIHGASLVNLSIYNSKLLNSTFSTRFVNISPASQIDDIGRVSILKVLRTFRIYLNSIYSYVTLKPDLVYMTLSPTGLALYKDAALSIFLKIIGGKMIFHMHGKGILEASSTSILRQCIYKAAFCRSNVIHLSDVFFNDVSKFVNRRNFFVVGNGIESAIPKISKENSNPIRFLFLSNFIREKGPLDLLAACELLPDISDKFEVIMAGKFFDDSIKRDFSEFFDRYEFRNITILDHGAYKDEKLNLLVESHVMILPTYNDCFPLSLLEAMSARMAIISTDEGAIGDLVSHHENGVIVEPKSPESIARAMRYFVENPDEAIRMGEAGCSRFHERYTLEIFEQRLCDVFREIGGRN